MANLKQIMIITNLKKKLKYYREQSKCLGLLLDTFDMNKYNYAIVGGFVRNTIKFGVNSTFQDFDIIVDIPYEELRHILKHYRFHFDENSNGGFKIKEEYHPIDIWTMDSHQPFKTHIILNPDKKFTFRDVSLSSELSIDNCVFVPRKNKLYWKYLKQTLKTNKIFFILESPFLADWKCACRLKYFSKVCGYELDDICASFVKEVFNSNSYGKKARKYYKHLLEKVNI